MSYVVVGDCGGTNTRLSLWEIPTGASRPNRGERAPGNLKFDKKYLNEQHQNFVAILKLFLQDSQCGTTPKAACLACAGPILDNTVSFTNIASGWFIDGKELEKDLGIARVMLVNDFTAMGYGLLTLRNDECVIINDVPPVEGGVIATIGAGTGLGECYLTKDPRKNQYVCWPSEGGHTDFPPRDELEVELHNHLRQRFNQKQRVSVERVISGPGIACIYDFLVEKFPQKVNKDIHQKIEAAGSLKGGEVAKNASNDPICKQAVDIFFTAYASEAGNALLKWLPTGGFYISGGIAAKNIDRFSPDSAFTGTMFDKGRLSVAMRKCPVYVCKTDDVGERGAHLVAFSLLQTI